LEVVVGGSNKSGGSILMWVRRERCSDWVNCGGTGGRRKIQEIYRKLYT
jgi:hypothetical protein